MGVLLYSVNLHPIVKIKIKQQHGAHISNYLCCFYFRFYFNFITGCMITIYKNVAFCICNNSILSNNINIKIDATIIILILLIISISSTCFGRLFRPSSGALDCVYSLWYKAQTMLPAGTSCKHCIVLLRMGEIIARNMLS